MKTIVRVPVYEGNKVVLRNVDIGVIQGLNETVVMGIDGSTSCTGIGLIRASDGALVASLAFKHEKDKESAVKYKVLLKKQVYKLLSANKAIVNTFYEEPFLGYATSVKNLMMLRTFMEELIYENEPELDYIKFAELNNLKWKKLFLDPEKVPTGTDNQKRAVREKLIKMMPCLEEVTQDEVDAIAMAYTAATKLRDGSGDELKNKVKPKPFKYQVKFIGADTDDIMLMELGDTLENIGTAASNGIQLVQLKGRENWDKQIYELMGQDDKLLILKFSSNKFGNIILQYKLGYLTSYEYIYALVWRVNRKRV